MSNGWDEFLDQATAPEVFKKVRDKITMNPDLTDKQKSQMTDKVWLMWKERQILKKYGRTEDWDED